jgi:hypothetical protein
MPPRATSGINGPFEPVSPTDGQVVYVLLNRLPLNRIAPAPLDLHTLGTPLAFVLSQDQTLHVMVEDRAKRKAPGAKRSADVPPTLCALRLALCSAQGVT